MALKDAEAARQVDPENPTVVSTAPAFERLKTAIPKIRAADLVLSKNPKDLGALVARSYWRRFAGLSNDLSLRDAEAAFETHKDSRAALLSVALTSPLSKSEIRKRYAVIPDFPELDASQFAALVELDLAVHASPKKDEALVKRAYILSSRPAQYELALKDADAALELNPANTSAWIERIYALGKLKQINLAAAALHSLEALKPSAQGLSTALRYYADAEFEAGELMSALGTVNRSLELAPSAFAYKLRAAVYQRLSRTSEAQADLEKAAALDKSPTR
jgi:tetratricopeptide (TPR) repeat protein